MKLKCGECGWCGLREAILTAPNPFADTAEVWGCPACKDVNTLTPACDEQGCTDTASNGWPSGDGYRHTCWRHSPYSRK